MSSAWTGTTSKDISSLLRCAGDTVQRSSPVISLRSAILNPSVLLIYLAANLLTVCTSWLGLSNKALKNLQNLEGRLTLSEARPWLGQSVVGRFCIPDERPMPALLLFSRKKTPYLLLDCEDPRDCCHTLQYSTFLLHVFVVLDGKIQKFLWFSLMSQYTVHASPYSHAALSHLGELFVPGAQL